MTVPEEDAASDDPEERLYASAPIDTDDGEVVVIHEQDAAGERRAGARLVSRRPASYGDPLTPASS